MFYKSVKFEIEVIENEVLVKFQYLFAKNRKPLEPSWLADIEIIMKILLLCFPQKFSISFFHHCI